MAKPVSAKGALADEREAIRQYGKLESKTSSPRLKKIASSNRKDEKKHAAKLEEYESL